MKFLKRPTTAQSNPFQSQFLWCIDEDHRITQLPPTRFDQDGRVEQDRLLASHFGTRDLVCDLPRDLGVYDLL